MEHATIVKIEQATVFGRQETFRLGMALLFIVGVMFWSYVRHEGMTSGHMMLVISRDDGWLHGLEHRRERRCQ